METQVLFLPESNYTYCFRSDNNPIKERNHGLLRVLLKAAIAFTNRFGFNEYFIFGNIKKSQFWVSRLIPSLNKVSEVLCEAWIRSFARACVFKNQLFYIGGIEDLQEEKVMNYLSSCVVFTLPGKIDRGFVLKVEKVVEMNLARSDFGLSVSENYIYVVGGSGKYGFMSSCERYDGQHWVVLPLSLQTASCKSGLFVITDSQLLILGGRKKANQGSSHEIELFDLASEKVTLKRGIGEECRVFSSQLIVWNKKIVTVDVDGKLAEYKPDIIDWATRRAVILLRYFLRPNSII